jgi:hypothetical protein
MYTVGEALAKAYGELTEVPEILEDDRTFSEMTEDFPCVEELVFCTMYTTSTGEKVTVSVGVRVELAEAAVVPKPRLSLVV